MKKSRKVWSRAVLPAAIAALVLGAVGVRTVALMATPANAQDVNVQLPSRGSGGPAAVAPAGGASFVAAPGAPLPEMAPPAAGLSPASASAAADSGLSIEGLSWRAGGIGSDKPTTVTVAESLLMDVIDLDYNASSVSLFGDSQADRRLQASWQDDVVAPTYWPDVVVPEESREDYRRRGLVESYRTGTLTVRTDNFSPIGAMLNHLNGQAQKMRILMPVGQYGVGLQLKYRTYLKESSGLLLPISMNPPADTGAASTPTDPAAVPGLAPVLRKSAGLLPAQGDKPAQVVEVDRSFICVNAKDQPLALDVAFIDSNQIITDVLHLKPGAVVTERARDMGNFDEAVNGIDFTLKATEGETPEVCSPFNAVTGSPVKFVLLANDGWFRRAGLNAGARAIATDY